MRDSAAAARATRAPLLAKLPQIEFSGDGMVLLSDPSSAGAEAFRRLRAILAPPPGGTARTVLFASARAGEGKSFCALNYASSLAMQGHRTLLLDADLRRPGLSRQHLAEALKYGGGTNKNVHSGLVWLRSIQGCVRLTTSASVSMTMGCW